MKILLVKPSIKMSDHIQPPLGLGYIASSIKDKHKVEILDLPRYNGALKYFDQYMTRLQPDIIGFQCYTSEVSTVRELLIMAKSKNPDFITIAGGPHPTLLPDETLEYFGGNIDYLLRGEVEKGFKRLLDNLECQRDLSDVPGLVWNENGRINRNPPQLIDDLDSIALPAWDLIRPQEYPPAQHGAFFRRFPIAPIITTRGCPFSCIFCSAPVISGKKVRTRSVDNIIKEIKLLYNEFGIREIHIVDDNFTINKDHAKNVLNGIIRADLDISIAFPNGVRIESLDSELIMLMKRSGVYLVSLGIESGNDEVLKSMNKQLTVGLIEEKIDIIKKYDIDIAGFFVIGFSGETEDTIKRTIDFSIKLPLIRANYFEFIPLPGTELYRSLLTKGEIREVDWARYLFITTPFVPKDMTKKTLRNLQRLAFARFYLRPRILFKNILQIKSLVHLKYLIKRFYHWIIM
ncbi:MAG: radical SAM protein [Elusimicrobiota bacterium]